MSALAYILVALAVYRVATDLAWEDGPVEAFAWLRGQAHVRFGPAHWATNGLSCPICLSFWVTPLVLLLWHTEARPLVMWLAVAGAAAFLARWK